MREVIENNNFCKYDNIYLYGRRVYRCVPTGKLATYYAEKVRIALQCATHY